MVNRKKLNNDAAIVLATGLTHHPMILYIKSQSQVGKEPLLFTKLSILFPKLFFNLLNCPNYYLLNCWHYQICLTFLHLDHLDNN